MYDIDGKLRSLTTLLRRIGKEDDYPDVWKEARFLNFYLGNLKFGPTEKRKLIVEHLEQLPDFLRSLKNRAHGENKKEAYERLIAKVEVSDFFALLAVWKHWDKSKDIVYNRVKEVIFRDETIRASITGSYGDPVISPAARRFEAKVDEILPQPRITPEDYEVLLKELETVLEGWREVTVDPEEREYVDDLILNTEEWITELYVLSLLDS